MFTALHWSNSAPPPTTMGRLLNLCRKPKLAIFGPKSGDFSGEKNAGIGEKVMRKLLNARRERKRISIGWRGTLGRGRCLSNRHTKCINRNRPSKKSLQKIVPQSFNTALFTKIYKSTAPGLFGDGDRLDCSKF